MKFLIILPFLSLLSCGIKGDPVPPVEPTDWGRGLEEENIVKEKSDKDESR